jgi:hypothetical protein
MQIANTRREIAFSTMVAREEKMEMQIDLA